MYFSMGEWLYCVSRSLVTPVFANFSSMVILIEKQIREMNLSVDRVIEFIFFHINMSFCNGWD